MLCMRVDDVRTDEGVCWCSMLRVDGVQSGEGVVQRLIKVRLLVTKVAGAWRGESRKSLSYPRLFDPLLAQ